MVTFTANASGCPNPQYQFWILAPGASAWQKAKAYSSSNQLVWITNALAPGTYRVTVWARDASSSGVNTNALGGWDASDNGFYTLS